jgi:hypothetical protein
MYNGLTCLWRTNEESWKKTVDRLYHCRWNRRDLALFRKQDCFDLIFSHAIIACYISRQFSYYLCQGYHNSVQECCKLTKTIICSLYMVWNSFVLNASSVDKGCFSVVLVTTKWVFYLDFNLEIKADSVAETSCCIKIRNGNIPGFVTANN